MVVPGVSGKEVAELEGSVGTLKRGVLVPSMCNRYIDVHMSNQ